MADLIDLHQASWGALYQGPPFDAVDQASLPRPLALVVMEKSSTVWIDHEDGIHLELRIGIDDSPEAVLPDGVVLGLARGIVGLLKGGINVRVQCGASVSRSSYATVATVMAALGVGYDIALSIVRSDHPIANPNSGFEGHLRRLEPQLIEGAGR